MEPVTPLMQGMKGAVVSLAFRVVPQGENLFSAEMLMLKGNTVVSKKTGAATTLGHAIGQTDNLLDGWAFDAIERKAEDYFREVVVF